MKREKRERKRGQNSLSECCLCFLPLDGGSTSLMGKDDAAEVSGRCDNQKKNDKEF